MSRPTLQAPAARAAVDDDYERDTNSDDPPVVLEDSDATDSKITSKPAVVVTPSLPPAPVTQIVYPKPATYGTASASLSADLIRKSGDSTKSTRTPMGKWFDKAVDLRISAMDKAFLESPEQDVAIPDAKKSEWKYTKVPVTLYPTKGKPHPGDGMQHAIGDCNMLAMLNSFAYQHPDFLQWIILDKGQGVFEISMFDPAARPIKVRVGSNFMVDKAGNLIGAGGDKNTPVWLSVLEKAIMKYNQVYKIWDGDGPAKVEGFGSEAGAPMLTGNGNSVGFFKATLNSPSDLNRIVKQALAAGKIVTGGFGQAMSLNGVKSVTGHAFTVLLPGDANTMISMRNPWGASPKDNGEYDSSAEGVLNIPFDANWFKTIDVRVMEPGIAGGIGATKSYQIRSQAQLSLTGNDVNAINLKIFEIFHKK